MWDYNFTDKSGKTIRLNEVKDLIYFYNRNGQYEVADNFETLLTDFDETKVTLTEHIMELTEDNHRVKSVMSEIYEMCSGIYDELETLDKATYWSKGTLALKLKNCKEAITNIVESIQDECGEGI